MAWLFICEYFEESEVLSTEITFILPRGQEQKIMTKVNYFIVSFLTEHLYSLALFIYLRTNKTEINWFKSK